MVIVGAGGNRTGMVVLGIAMVGLIAWVSILHGPSGLLLLIFLVPYVAFAFGQFRMRIEVTPHEIVLNSGYRTRRLVGPQTQLEWRTRRIWFSAQVRSVIGELWVISPDGTASRVPMTACPRSGPVGRSAEIADAVAKATGLPIIGGLAEPG